MLKRQIDVRYFLYQRRRQWRVEDKASAAGRMTPLLRVKFETKKANISHLVIKAASQLVRALLPRARQPPSLPVCRVLSIAVMMSVQLGTGDAVVAWS